LGNEPAYFSSAGLTRIMAIMPPSSCPRMWQW
jgi:hypothetical protein